MGKTTFAKNLVGGDDYCIEFRNTFTANALNKPNAALLLLDDMKWDKEL